MAAQGSDAPVVRQDLLPLTAWIEVLGRALLRKGVLSKEELVEELNEKAASGGGALEAEIERMIMQIESWRQVLPWPSVAILSPALRCSGSLEMFQSTMWISPR